MNFIPVRMIALMLLGGCACQKAIDGVEKAAIERPALAVMPQNCEFSGGFTGTVQALTCENGRQGFVIVGSE